MTDLQADERTEETHNSHKEYFPTEKIGSHFHDIEFLIAYAKGREPHTPKNKDKVRHILKTLHNFRLEDVLDATAVVDPEGRPLMHTALINRCPDLLNDLYEMRNPGDLNFLNKRDAEGNMLVHLAFFMKEIEKPGFEEFDTLDAVLLLLEMRADFRMEDRLGNTAAHYAAAQNDAVALVLIMEYECEGYVKPDNFLIFPNHKGLTPIDIAAQCKAQEVLAMADDPSFYWRQWQEKHTPNQEDFMAALACLKKNHEIEVTYKKPVQNQESSYQEEPQPCPENW